jgi:hypothetical protein
MKLNKEQLDEIQSRCQSLGGPFVVTNGSFAGEWLLLDYAHQPVARSLPNPEVGHDSMQFLENLAKLQEDVDALLLHIAALEAEGTS